MTSTDYHSSLQVIADDEEEDNYILLSCKLLVAAAGVVGTRRSCLGCRHIRRRAARFRVRRSVRDIYRGMGEKYFRRAYRMHYESFWRLHEKLEDGIESARLKSRGYEKKGGRAGGNYSLPPVKNGPITTSVRLACAIRFFAGGSPYDIMGKYEVSYSEVMESVWYVVEAVNTFDEFAIEYPESADEQDKIAQEFRHVSQAGIDICAGAIDGILIWIAKPTSKQAAIAAVNQGKFLCGRKGKFGLNCQAVSDVRGKILDISIGYGGSSSDCLAFERSQLFDRCEAGLMKNGNVLFGDNAYLNTQYMATPFTNVSGNQEQVTKDDYNFFHSQLRIRVECCFGMLVQRWGLLRTALHHSISITRIVGLVNCLARLHNFCISETDRLSLKRQINLRQRLAIDVQYMMESSTGYIGLQTTENGEVVPADLLNAVEPFADVPSNLMRNHRNRNPEDGLPRFHLHKMISDNHFRRPRKNIRRID